MATTQQITATATLLDSSTDDVTTETTYTTSDSAVATVDTAGLITSHAAGSATVTGNYAGLTDTIAVTVEAGVLDVTPATDTLAPLETQQLAASYTPAGGGTPEDVTATATYESSDPAVATVSSSGLVTGVAAGSATITVTHLAATDTVDVTVTA